MGIFGLFERRREAAPAAADRDGGARGAEYADRTAHVGDAQTALKVSSYYRALELRATKMGQLLWQYQKRNAEGGNFVADNYGPHGRLNYLLQVRPNALMTATAMQRQIEIDVIQKGNAYVWIERDLSDQPVGLWLATGGAYDVMGDRYTLTVCRPGGQVTLGRVEPRDVLHLRNTFTDASGLVGRPTIAYMRDVLTLDATNTRLQTETAAKGGRLKLLLREDKDARQGMLSRAPQSEVKKVGRRIQEDLNAGADVIVMSDILQATPISMNMTEMDVLAARRLTVEDVARFMAVPKMLLGDGSNSSYKSPEAAVEDFLTNCIAPNIRALEDELNSKLLGPGGFGRCRIHVCDKPLRRLDPAAQAALNKTLVEMGALTVNEVRSDYDRPTVAEGDRVYVSRQWEPLGAPLRGGDPNDIKDINDDKEEAKA